MIHKHEIIKNHTDCTVFVTMQSIHKTKHMNKQEESKICLYTNKTKFKETKTGILS